MSSAARARASLASTETISRRVAMPRSESSFCVASVSATSVAVASACINRARAEASCASALATLAASFEVSSRAMICPTATVSL